VFITHDLNEAMFLGDRIAVMRDGRIVQNGTPEEILTDPANGREHGAGLLRAQSSQRAAHAGAERSGQVGRFHDVVTDRAVIRAVKAGETDLRRIVDESVPTVGPDDLLSDVVETAVEATVPLAVIDEQRRLVQTTVPSVAASTSGVNSATMSIGVWMTGISRVVAADDLLSDVVETAVEATVPLAVIDEQRRLVGVIPRVTLLAALGNVPATTRDSPSGSR
jgi:glycine betaine/proline transport system ATP-binding protein